MDSKEADSLDSDSEDTLEMRGLLPPAKLPKCNATTANDKSKTKKMNFDRTRKKNKFHINIDMILNPEIKVPPAKEIPPEWRNDKNMMKVIRENRKADKAFKALYPKG